MMKERRLLVDFENVQKMDLSRLAEDFHVTVFVGSAQKTIPFELVEGAQRLGTRLEWIRAGGNGPNALDFHIAFYLGCCFTQFPKAECFILSKDSGFDPLVRHLAHKGFRCQRINSLIQLEPQRSADSEPNYKRMVEVLTKMEKKARPRKRTTLTQHVSTMFQKKLPEGEVERLIDMLFIEGKVSETGDTLSYSF